MQQTSNLKTFICTLKYNVHIHSVLKTKRNTTAESSTIFEKWYFSYLSRQLKYKIIMGHWRALAIIPTLQPLIELMQQRQYYLFILTESKKGIDEENFNLGHFLLNVTYNFWPEGLKCLAYTCFTK